MIDALRKGLLAGDAVSVGHCSLQSRAMDTRHFFVRGCRTARVRGAGRWHGRGAGARGRGANRRRAATARTGCGGRGRLVTLTPGAVGPGHRTPNPLPVWAGRSIHSARDFIAPHRKSPRLALFIVFLEQGRGERPPAGVAS